MAEIKHVELFIISFMLCQGFLVAFSCSSPTPDSLYAEIQNSKILKIPFRPVQNFSSPLYVKISIVLAGIIDVDEKAQTLTTLLWQTLEWNIAGLSWDENKCGTNRVSISLEKIWAPDITVMEIANDEQDGRILMRPYVYIFNTGNVREEKPLKMVTVCKLAIYYFPFDVQKCSLTFGSFLHIDKDIKMVQGDTNASVFINSKKALQTNGEWDILAFTNVEKLFKIHDKSYSLIQYKLILKRRPNVYVVNLLIPSCFLVLIDFFSFFIPMHGVDRASLKMTLILGYTVFLLIVNDLLPITGEKTPLINKFFCIILALMVASLLETIFITHIYFGSSGYRQVPSWLEVLVFQYIAVLVCIPRKRTEHIIIFPNSPLRGPTNDGNKNKYEGQHQLSELEKNFSLTVPLLDEMKKLSKDITVIRLHLEKKMHGFKNREDWEEIGVVLDRLFFCIYVVFLVTSFIRIICSWM